MLKAIGLGIIITGCVALVIGSQGSSGGFLQIHTMRMGEVAVLWSWPLFLASTGLFGGLILIQR